MFRYLVNKFIKLDYLKDLYKEKYDELQAGVKERQITADFFEALLRYDNGELIEAGPAGCDGDKCLLPLAKPE